MYTKLATSILTSTVWMECHETRIVWLTLLAMKDANGEVQASIPGLANVARVTVDEAERAINVFMAPDPYSRTKTDEGRRIEAIDGGWLVLNHDKYRDLSSDDDRKRKAANRQKRYRERQARNSGVTGASQSVTGASQSVTGCDKSHQISHTDTDTDTDTEAKADTKANTKTEEKTPLPPKGKPGKPADIEAELSRVEDARLRQTLQDWLQYKQERREAYKATGLRALVTQALRRSGEVSADKVCDMMNAAMSANWAGWDHAGTNQPTERLTTAQQREKNSWEATAKWREAMKSEDPLAVFLECRK